MAAITIPESKDSGTTTLDVNYIVGLICKSTPSYSVASVGGTQVGCSNILTFKSSTGTQYYIPVFTNGEAGY